MNVPNIITVARTLLVPVVFWLVISGHDIAAFALFVIAGISDALDGYLARRLDLRTELGAHLDPLADKLLIVSIFIALGMRGEVPSWLVITVVARDILILIGIMLASMLGKPVTIAPLQISKMTTVAQISLAALVLANAAFSLGLGSGLIVVVWGTAVLTVASLIAYLRIWIFHMSGE
ncbi:MAG: CDP-alcohol phosphatidyltransferase family protein [Alphaproteobacteria bacterium]|nr:CDP-alcohol phosphatidyltransferase family protein [Alphaproteobacteria bacterium]